MFPIRDTIPSRSLPVVTWTLIGLNAVVYLQTAFLPPAYLQRLFDVAGLVPARYSNPEWWVAAKGLPAGGVLPFFSSMFLHGGFFHLLSNMWTLWIFGDNVEDRMGKLRFLAFYLSTGLAAGLLHLVTNLGSPVPTVGASGAISGVLGAYLVLYPRARIIAVFPIFFYPLFFELPAFVYLAFWFLTQLLSGTMSLGGGELHGVAWWAHIGGFLAGLALYRTFVRRAPRYVLQPRRRGERSLVIDYPPRDPRWR